MVLGSVQRRCGSAAARVGVVARRRWSSPYVGGGLGGLAGLTHSCRSFYKTHHHLLSQAFPRHPCYPRLPSARSLQPAVQPHRRLISHATARMSEAKWPGALVRKTYFDFFEERGHTLGKLDAAALVHSLPPPPSEVHHHPSLAILCPSPWQKMVAPSYFEHLIFMALVCTFFSL